MCTFSHIILFINHVTNLNNLMGYLKYLTKKRVILKETHIQSFE